MNTLLINAAVNMVKDLYNGTGNVWYAVSTDGSVAVFVTDKNYHTIRLDFPATWVPPVYDHLAHSPLV